MALKKEIDEQIEYPEGAIPVLDKGFVRLVDVMGDDSAIVQSARVSYGKGTKTVNQDEGLIRYLLRHRHTTPFEMVEFKFHARMPVFIARQWIRHRTANVNEVSARYSEMPDWFYSPEEAVCTTQSTINKQGGSDELVLQTSEAADIIDQVSKETYSKYQELIQSGLRRELARAVLPVSLYTEWYWKIDLHNLLHFLELRMDSHAQYEIREFAFAMAEFVKKQVPLTWKAFEDYRLKSMQFSGPEIEELKKMLDKNNAYNGPELPTKRENSEFLAKMSKLGLQSFD